MQSTVFIHNPLYNDIINAFECVMKLGMTVERRKNDEFISQREVLKRYGKKYRDLYIAKFGFPKRNSGTMNSKRQFSLNKLDQLKAADTATRSVVEFESEVVRRERKLNSKK